MQNYSLTGWIAGVNLVYLCSLALLKNIEHLKTGFSIQEQPLFLEPVLINRFEESRDLKILLFSLK